ncbi:MAG: triose-phosphate isomerase [Candidatus Brocadiia bacterium]|nr:MAG: triose-phosphate isomerase [Candidatus Brocadiia bacterium]
MRKPFVAGNWKMNMNTLSSAKLAEGVRAGTNGVAGSKVDVALIPPFVYIPAAVNALRATDIAVGAQDVYFETEGAFTGEISPAMLKDIGCTYVLCGHSERRHVIGETDEMINKKVTAAINGGLLPILCVGELLQERQAEKTEEVVVRQIKKGMAGLSPEKASAVTIAYEPVWAIGTGLTAPPAQAQDVHKLIRNLIADMYGRELADDIRIQYGGSAKPSNAAELMAKEDVDGLLVGGASLKSDEFNAIIIAALK